jgi:hypothetical protein
MKYVILADNYPVVFSELQSHAEVASAFHMEATCAGFCGLTREHKFICYGESVSLKVASKPEPDTKLINRLFGLIEY